MTPAILLIICILGVIVLAILLARLTTKRPSDNGLRYEYQNPRNYRKQ